MNLLTLLEGLKEYLPKWLLSVIAVISLLFGSYYYIMDGDLTKIQTVLGKEVHKIPVPTSSELENLLLKTSADHVGYWEYSEYVPQSSSIIASKYKNKTHDVNVSRFKVLNKQTPKKTLKHLETVCYSGEPERTSLISSGINHVISCPIILGNDRDSMTLEGYIQLEYTQKPSNLACTVSLLREITFDIRQKQ